MILPEDSRKALKRMGIEGIEGLIIERRHHFSSHFSRVLPFKEKTPGFFLIGAQFIAEGLKANFKLLVRIADVYKAGVGINLVFLYEINLQSQPPAKIPVHRKSNVVQALLRIGPIGL